MLEKKIITVLVEVIKAEKYKLFFSVFKAVHFLDQNFTPNITVTQYIEYTIQVYTENDHL